MTSSALFPITDDPTRWVNMSEAHKTLKIASGEFLPTPVSDWTKVDVTSDVALARMTFAGYAGQRLRLLTTAEQNIERDEQNEELRAVYVSDFSDLLSLEVRAGYERFGARAYFNGKNVLVKIHWSAANIMVRPGEKYWEHAKWVWRCSSLLGITGTEHLTWGHMHYSNFVSTGMLVATAYLLPKIYLVYFAQK